jgi:4-hydroxy-2-oxoheptanedioate aldolase
MAYHGPILRQQLFAGGTVIGAIVPIDSPTLVELCGIAGFDFVFLDTEHGEVSHASYEDLVRAADIAQIPAVVRVAPNQPIEIGRALDAGAQGIHAPFVQTVEQAQMVVHAARFAPAGQRGLGPVRAARYGFEPLDAYVQRSNEQTLVVAAVESPDAVGEIAAIGALPGVDVIFVAPADLSATLGFPGQFDHPAVTELIGRAIASAKATGKMVGSLAFSTEHARQLAEQGVQYILMVLTSVIVRSAQSWLGVARQE